MAAALGKLGSKVALLTALGNDDLGQKMKDLLEGVQLGYPDLPHPMPDHSPAQRGG